MLNYAVKTSAGTSVCTHPFTEKVVESEGVPLENQAAKAGEPVDLTTEEVTKLRSNEWEQEKMNGGIVFTEAEPPALNAAQQAREDLKAKFLAGTQTPEDILEALKLLL